MKGWYDPWDPEWEDPPEGWNWGLLAALVVCVMFWAAIVIGCSYMIRGR